MAKQGTLTEDVLFVGVTRPAMRWGVTYGAIITIAMVTLQVFLLSKNLLTLLIVLPLHGACYLLCLRDVRCFDLLALWFRTSLVRGLQTRGRWGAASCGALEVRRVALRALARPGDAP